MPRTIWNSQKSNNSMDQQPWRGRYSIPPLLFKKILFCVCSIENLFYPFLCRVHGFSELFSMGKGVLGRIKWPLPLRLAFEIVCKQKIACRFECFRFTKLAESREKYLALFVEASVLRRDHDLRYKMIICITKNCIRI